MVVEQQHRFRDLKINPIFIISSGIMLLMQKQRLRSLKIFRFLMKQDTGTYPEQICWKLFLYPQIGYLSPYLHLYFDRFATAFTAIASGLFDTIGLFRQLNHGQEKLVQEWLQFQGCTLYSNRLLRSLPAGIQRLILSGHAMIKTPPLLILDKPCQGLDGAQTAFALQTVDRYCALYGTNLIFVSHYTRDFPAFITQSLKLEKGKIA
jgi:ABC-type molybdenum transport system ATPase subunit/photorepair protein PhrA